MSKATAQCKKCSFEENSARTVRALHATDAVDQRASRPLIGLHSIAHLLEIQHPLLSLVCQQVNGKVQKLQLCRKQRQ